MHIRPASIDDCPELARVLIGATLDAFTGRVPDKCLDWLSPEDSATNWAKNFGSRRGSDQELRVFVMESDEGQVIGLAAVGATSRSPTDDQTVTDRYPVELVSLQVDPAWQRREVGRGLVSYVAQFLVREGTTRLLVRVLADNPNLEFYDRLGAVRIGSQRYDWEGYETREIIYAWDDLPELNST